jgi:uncharacterized membrane protein
MKPRLQLQDLLVLLLTGIPFLYLYYRYPYLPETVATHFGANGQANGYSAKSSLWMILSLVAGAGIFVYLLIRFLPLIDPKKGARYSGGVYNKIAILLLAFMAAINFLIIVGAEKNKFSMGGVKPNYFIGVRTPWTLENEDNWRSTHQLTGKLWVAGGLTMVLGGLLFSETVSAYILMGTILVMVVVPIAYSFWYYRNQQKINNQ